MAFPWAAAVMAAMFLADKIFPGSGKSQPQTQETETTTETPVTKWRDPAMGFMSPFSIKMMLSNLGSMQGAGMPKGYGGLGMGDWTKDIIAMLEKAWPDIMGGLSSSPSKYTGSGGGGGIGPEEEDRFGRPARRGRPEF